MKRMKILSANFLQSGYIDGPILSTFRMNLVILPMILEYAQYTLIGLGLGCIIGAVALLLTKKVYLNDQWNTTVTVRCYLTAVGLYLHLKICNLFFFFNVGLWILTLKCHEFLFALYSWVVKLPVSFMLHPSNFTHFETYFLLHVVFCRETTHKGYLES